MNKNLARTYTKDKYERCTKPVGVTRNHVTTNQITIEDYKNRDDVLPKITVPTLIIHGKKDPVLFYARDGKAIANALTHAQLLTIPGWGHIFSNRMLVDLFVKETCGFESEINNNK